MAIFSDAFRDPLRPPLLNPALPSRALLLKWLLESGVIQQDGSVLSWLNPARPGFAYPEAAGLLAACLVQEPEAAPYGRHIARRLLETVPDSGGFGKNGTLYVFDTAIILSSLTPVIASAGSAGTGSAGASPALCVSASRARGLPDSDRFALDRMFHFVARALEDGVSRIPSPADASHWSDAFGCHLLKATASLIAFARAFRPSLAPRAGLLAGRVLARLLPLCDGGRFRIHAASTLTYTHSHCYAVEGLISLADLGAFHDPRLIARCSDWLAAVQRPDGAIPPWHDGPRSWGEPRGDAAAQAVIIWSCVDHRAFAKHISAALAFLATLQTPEGGLRYCPSSADTNTWVTAFALSALRASSSLAAWAIR